MSNTGGPAFPRPMGHNGMTHHEEHESSAAEKGMTLRDYFAAMAMQRMVDGLVADESAETLSQLASDAYAVADAMLTERAK